MTVILGQELKLITNEVCGESAVAEPPRRLAIKEILSIR